MIFVSFDVFFVFILGNIFWRFLNVLLIFIICFFLCVFVVFCLYLLSGGGLVFGFGCFGFWCLCLFCIWFIKVMFFKVIIFILDNVYFIGLFIGRIRVFGGFIVFILNVLEVCFVFIIWFLFYDDIWIVILKIIIFVGW